MGSSLLSVFCLCFTLGKIAGSISSPLHMPCGSFQNNLLQSHFAAFAFTFAHSVRQITVIVMATATLEEKCNLKGKKYIALEQYSHHLNFFHILSTHSDSFWRDFR